MTDARVRMRSKSATGISKGCLLISPPPDQAVRVSVKASLAYVEQFAGTDPIALVVSDPQIVFQIQPERVWFAKAVGPGDGLAVGSDFHDPSAIGCAGVHVSVVSGATVTSPHFVGEEVPEGGTCAESIVEVAFLVLDRTEVEFRVVARHAEIVRYGFEKVCFAVFVPVDELGDLRTLCNEDFVVVEREDPERSVQAFSEKIPLTRVGVVEKYFAQRESASQAPIGHERDGIRTGFAFGQRDGFEIVLIENRRFWINLRTRKDGGRQHQDQEVCDGLDG